MEKIEVSVANSTEARLENIRKAAKGNFEVSSDSPEEVRVGVALLKSGGEITPEWLAEIDKHNSYI